MSKIKQCPSCEKNEEFTVVETLVHRGNFDDGQLNVKNRDNTIDSVTCDSCQHQFTAAEIENEMDINFT